MTELLRRYYLYNTGMLPVAELPRLVEWCNENLTDYRLDNNGLMLFIEASEATYFTLVSGLTHYTAIDIELGK